MLGDNGTMLRVIASRHLMDAPSIHQHCSALVGPSFWPGR
jgi:hypothetical protein